MISLGQKSRNNKVIRVIHRHKHVGLPKITKKETPPQKNISEAISELNRERDSIVSNTNQLSKLKQLLLSGNSDVRGQLQKKINEAVNQQNNKNTIIENQKKQLNQIKQNLKNQQLAMKNLVNSKNVSQKTSYGNQPQAKQQQVNSKNSRNRPQTNIRYQSQIQQQQQQQQGNQQGNQQQKRQRPQWTAAGQIIKPWDHEQQHAILDLIEKYKKLYKTGIQDLINFQQKCKKQAEETQKAQNVLYKKKETAWRVESDKKDTAWRTESAKANVATQAARKARDKAQLAKLVAKDRELSTHD